MRWEIRHRGVKVTEEMRAYIAERLRLALGRLAGYIDEVRIYLKDVNGPRGGADKVCQIVVGVRRDGQVVVTGVDSEIYAAITSTANRAGFAVRRHIKRRLARRRRPRRVGQELSPWAAGEPLGMTALTDRPSEVEVFGRQTLVGGVAH